MHTLLQAEVVMRALFRMRVWLLWPAWFTLRNHPVVPWLSTCGLLQRHYAKKGGGRGQTALGEEEQEVTDLGKLESGMEAAVKGLKWEYANSITARITPASLDRLMVEVEGEQVPLRQVGQIGMPNPQMLQINMSSYPQAMGAVVNALRVANEHLNPIPDQNTIKVPIPKVTKELRERLVKLAKVNAEKAKVGIRKARQKGISDVRKRKGTVSEDSIHRIEKHIQQMTDKHTKTVDELFQAKSAELMKGR